MGQKASHADVVHYNALCLGHLGDHDIHHYDMQALVEQKFGLLTRCWEWNRSENPFFLAVEATPAYEVGNADGKPMSPLEETLELVIYTLDGVVVIGLGTQEEIAEQVLGDGGALQENASQNLP